jgi:cytochrome c nitrite reductase small subunit
VRLTLALAALAGFTVALGIVTVSYADGTAYLSDDPTACIQCHIMRDQFDSWVKSSHHAVATCNGCHVPEGFVRKWWTKADNGYFHSWAFTFRNHPDPIRIKPRNRRIAEANCVRCHAELTHALLSDAPAGAGVSCLHCHKDAGHAAFR